MAYSALFGSPPDGIAASGYDAMRLLARAIETAGSLDRVAVRDAFAKSQRLQRGNNHFTLRCEPPPRQKSRNPSHSGWTG